MTTTITGYNTLSDIIGVNQASSFRTLTTPDLYLSAELAWVSAVAAYLLIVTVGSSSSGGGARWGGDNFGALTFEHDGSSPNLLVRAAQAAIGPYTFANTGISGANNLNLTTHQPSFDLRFDLTWASTSSAALSRTVLTDTATIVEIPSPPSGPGASSSTMLRISAYAFPRAVADQAGRCVLPTFDGGAIIPVFVADPIVVITPPPTCT